MIGITQSEYDEYKSKNHQSLRWLKARILFPDRGGISSECEDELIQFFERRQPDSQWKAVSKSGSAAELVPNLSEKSTAVWRRLEAERSKSRSLAVEIGRELSYGRGSDWWPRLKGLPKEERRREANKWIEQGGWNNLEREYDIGNTSDEEDDDWDTDGDKYLERDHPVAKMEEAVPVTMDELASFELREVQEAEQKEQQEEEQVEQEEERELELEEAVPVTMDELASFKLREEQEEELEAERDDELEEGSAEGKVQIKEAIPVSNDELD